MTGTLISLVSIFLGIIGAIIVGSIYKKYSFGILGNTIAGVFGSIFFIKIFGRLGFDPYSIMNHGTINIFLFNINSVVSFLGGIIGLVAVNYFKTVVSKKE